jgi:DNA-binding CsgD family transcriptional regulator
MSAASTLVTALDPTAESAGVSDTQSPANGRTRSLTRRQRDCLLLVARGNNDEQIARALGISKLTAHKHVEAAKRRYGVTTRVRLVVDALFANELSFAAIFAVDGL